MRELLDKRFVLDSSDFRFGSRLCENDLLIRANTNVPHEGLHDEAVHRR